MIVYFVLYHFMFSSSLQLMNTSFIRRDQGYERKNYHTKKKIHSTIYGIFVQLYCIQTKDITRDRKNILYDAYVV